MLEHLHTLVELLQEQNKVLTKRIKDLEKRYTHTQNSLDKLK